MRAPGAASPPPVEKVESMKFEGTKNYVATDDLRVAVNARSRSSVRFW